MKNFYKNKSQPIVAAIQMCSSDHVDDNLKIAQQWIIEAARNEARLVVLPEMFAMMGASPQDKVLVKEPFGQGKIQNFLSEQARSNKTWIVGGTIPITCDNPDKVRAACLVFNDEGDCVARYDKIHLFDVTLSEDESYKESETTQGGDEMIVIDTPFGKLGLAVCYDIRFPELFRCLLNKGAEIIAIPAAFTFTTGVAHWELLIRTRAIENFCYMIGACQGGTHPNNRSTYGNSMIIEPWGTIAAKKEGTDSGVIYSSIDLNKLNHARKSIPVQTHQRIFFDKKS